MKKHRSRKLALAKETIRELGGTTLSGVAGGATDNGGGGGETNPRPTEGLGCKPTVNEET